MARPRSEDRRNAILAAAAELVAEQGLGAATAEIAKRAAVPHGSIFTYFDTKSELLNTLYIELTTELSDCVIAAIEAGHDTRSRFQNLWQAWTGWGVTNPAKRRAQVQLSVSDQVTEASRSTTLVYAASIYALIREVSGKGVLAGVSLDYIGSLVDSWATTTTNYMTRDPARADALCEAGFNALWRSLT